MAMHREFYFVLILRYNFNYIRNTGLFENEPVFFYVKIKVNNSKRLQKPIPYDILRTVPAGTSRSIARGNMREHGHS